MSIPLAIVLFILLVLYKASKRTRRDATGLILCALLVLAVGVVNYAAG